MKSHSMKRLFSSSVLFLYLFLQLLFVSHVNAQQPLFKVLKVVDGDTIAVDVRGKKETIRLLGIDTPESVDPRKTVQCFSKEATSKMKSLVENKSVILIDDTSQGDRDKYNRLLRYVYLPNSVRTFVNGEMIKQGYAFSYKQYPTKFLTKFNEFEKYARDHNLGLWGSCPFNSSPTKKTDAKVYNAPLPSSPRNNTFGGTSSGGDKDCSDFTTQAQAQAYFTSKGGSPSNNVDRLDSDHDGIACESLP